MTFDLDLGFRGVLCLLVLLIVTWMLSALALTQVSFPVNYIALASTVSPWFVWALLVERERERRSPMQTVKKPEFDDREFREQS